MPDYLALIDRCFEEPDNGAVLDEFHATLGREIRIYLAARSFGQPALAEDAYQNAFVKFLEVFRDGSKRGVVRTGYLVSIAKNCLVDGARRVSREHPATELLEELLGGTENRTEERLALFQAMDLLDDRCRYAIESYYIGGASAQELARHLEVDQSSIYTILSRCRKRLRAFLSPPGERG